MFTVNVIHSFLKTDPKGIVSEHNVHISGFSISFHTSVSSCPQNKENFSFV